MDDFELVSHPTSPADRLDYHLFGTAFCPAHKSHLLSWRRCPQAFWLRQVQGYHGYGAAPWFAIGRFYHRIMQLAAMHPDYSGDRLYQVALEETTPTEKLALNAGALRNGGTLARVYAGKITGKPETTWLTEIAGFWFAGSFDNMDDENHVITDYKTNDMPNQFTADNGIEATVYRLAYKQLRGTLPTMRYIRLSQHWSEARKPSEITASGPIPDASIDELRKIVTEIRNGSTYRHFSADCQNCSVAALCCKPPHLLPEQKNERNA